MNKTSIIGLAAGCLLLGVLIGALIVQASSPTTIFYLSGGIYPGAPAYTVWRESTGYFAKANNGRLAASGTNFTAVAAYCVGNMTTNGGTIHLEPGYYEGWVVINRDGVILEGEGCLAAQTDLKTEPAPSALYGSVIKPPTGKNGITISGYNTSAGWRYGIQIRNLGIWFTTGTTGHGITTGTTYNVTTVTNMVVEHVKVLNHDKDHYALQLCNFLYSTFRDILSWGGPMLDLYANSGWLQQGNSVFDSLKGSIYYNFSIPSFDVGPYPIFIHRNSSAVNCWTNFLTMYRLQLNNPTMQTDSDYFTFVCWDLRCSTIINLDLEGANLANRTLLMGSCSKVTFETPYLWEQSPHIAGMDLASNNDHITFRNGYLGNVQDGNYTDLYDNCEIWGTISASTQARFEGLANNTGIATTSSGTVTVTARFIGPRDSVLITPIETAVMTALKVDTINVAPTNTFVVNCINETASGSYSFFWKVVHNDATP